MRIGYVGNANSLECKANRSFRLASYSPQRLVETIESNLSCLDKIQQFSAQQAILFYRISSDLIPFASHPICKFDWVRHFNGQSKRLSKTQGAYPAPQHHLKWRQSNAHWPR